MGRSAAGTRAVRSLLPSRPRCCPRCPAQRVWPIHPAAQASACVRLSAEARSCRAHAPPARTLPCRRVPAPHHFVGLPVDGLPHCAIGAVAQLLDHLVPAEREQRKNGRGTRTSTPLTVGRTRVERARKRLGPARHSCQARTCSSSLLGRSSRSTWGDRDQERAREEPRCLLPTGLTRGVWPQWTPWCCSG